MQYPASSGRPPSRTAHPWGGTSPGPGPVRTSERGGMEAKGPLIKMTGEGDKEGRVSKDNPPAAKRATRERTSTWNRETRGGATEGLSHLLVAAVVQDRTQITSTRRSKTSGVPTCGSIPKPGRDLDGKSGTRSVNSRPPFPRARRRASRHHCEHTRRRLWMARRTEHPGVSREGTSSVD